MGKNKKRKTQKIKIEKGKKYEEDSLNEETKAIQMRERELNELKQIKKDSLKNLNERLTNEEISEKERVEALRNFTKKQIKANNLLTSKLNAPPIKKRRKVTKKAKRKAKDIKDKVGVSGYLEYYWDASSKVYQLIPLPTLTPVTLVTNLGELYLTDTPSKYKNGKPVFIVIRGLPWAIPMDFEFEDLIGKIEKIKDIDPGYKFGRVGLSSWDLYAKYESSATWRLFHFKKITWRNIFTVLVSMLFGALITYVFLSPSLFTG